MNTRLPTFFLYNIVLVFLSILLSCSRTTNDKNKSVEDYISTYRHSSVDSLRRLVHDADVSKKTDLRIVSRILLAHQLTQQVDSIHSSSETVLLAAAEITGKSKNRDLQVWSYTQIGYYYYIFYNFTKATSYFIRSSKLLDSEQARSPIDIVDVYKKNGYFFGQIGEQEKSISYLKKALSNAAYGSEEYLIILFNLGSSYIEIKHYDDATYFLKEALEVATSLNDTDYYSKVIGGMALIAQLEKRYQEAEKLWIKDIELSEKSGNERNKMFASLHLSRLYLDNNEEHKAFQTIQQAHQFVQKRPYLAGWNYEISDLLKSYYHTIGDDRSELDIRRQLDSIGSAEHYQTGEAKITRILQQSQREMLTWELESERLKAERAIVYQWAWVTIALILIVVIILVVVLEKREHKLRQDQYEKELLSYHLQKADSESTLRETNSTLTAYKKYLDEKNKQIDLLKKRLQKIGDSKSKTLSKHRTGIDELLQSHLMTEKNWQEFKQVFMNEQQAYYDELIHDFPQLTEANLRTILLAKLGLKNQEIADILGLTKDAVKKSKQRLRKKYGDSYIQIIQED